MRDHPKMISDPFSDVLQLVKAESVLSGGFTAGDSWAIRFPAREKIKFCAIMRGRCWIRIETEPAPFQAEAGDVLLLSANHAFVLASDPSVTPVDGAQVFAGSVGKIADLGGEDFFQLGGHVQLDPVNGRILSDVLPEWIHIRAQAPQASVLRWIFEQLVREQTSDLLGAGAVYQQLAQLLFVQILRAYQEGSDSFRPGWLKALGDPRIGRSLRRIHADPGHSWNLGELAEVAAMSRTNFALRFKALAGVPPLTYLLQWRMHRAEQMLRKQNMPVSMLAQSLGYTSESAFSNAFKRTVGLSPKHYRAACPSLPDLP